MPSRRHHHRGHIRTLPSGSFQAIVYAGTDPLTGKERYLRETAATYAGAEKALTRLQGQVDEDRHPKSAITMRQAITQWLDVVELEDTTRERYDDLIRLYILPILGDMLASKVDAELLERFYARLHRCRALCMGRPVAGHVCRPLSTSTTRKIHYIIRGALERAVRWQHLGVNKAAMAEAPSPNRTEPDPPSAEEAAALLNAAWADPEWGLLLWLTMITGSRRGEVSALRWRHVDTDHEVLWIHRSNAQTKAGIKEKETKTGQRRKIAFDPYTTELLEAHRTLWEQRCADLGCALDPDAFLFSPTPDGSKPHPPRAISQRYRRMAIKLKLRSTRIHSLRHYSATELVAAGVDVRTVAGRLGHGSGGATTLKVYAAWVDEADRRAAVTMADIMPRPVAVQQARGEYEKIAALLREDIRAGRLKPGDQLPTVAELAAAHTVAVGTAHRALALLRDEHLIEVTRGRRAIVAAAPFRVNEAVTNHVPRGINRGQGHQSRRPTLDDHALAC
ncbi:MAG: tyrosine-type recombinase/integrase [Pseudonocardiaceae bacterium]